MYKDLWIVHLLIETIVSGFVEIMSMFEKEQSLMNRFWGVWIVLTCLAFVDMCSSGNG